MGIRPDKINLLREVWTVIKDNIQPPLDDDDGDARDDPSAHECPKEPEGILDLAGLDDIAWDADDVWDMLYQMNPDVIGAIREVMRLRGLILERQEQQQQEDLDEWRALST